MGKHTIISDSPRKFPIWLIGLWLTQLMFVVPIIVLFALRLIYGPPLGSLAWKVATISMTYAIVVLMFPLLPTGRRWLFSRRFQLVVFAAAGLLSYVVCEVIVSTVITDSRLPSVILFEDSGRTIHFDSVRGYKLMTTPSRWCRISHGTVEWVSTLRGNAQGFPDRDDFRVQRSDPNTFRVAVFGDSMTAGQYSSQNWPDHSEDLAREVGVPLELLNFSLDGGGLANWWSVLLKHVIAEGYEIDAVLFAVLPGDLERGFSMMELRGYDRYMFGRYPYWDPDNFPRTIEEARPYLQRQDGFVVSIEEFESALRGKLPRKKWVPYFSTRLFGRIKNAYAKIGRPSPKPFPHLQRRLIEDIRHVLQTREIPAYVVSVPFKETLLKPRQEIVPNETQVFAELINAKLINGVEAYNGLNDKDIRACWSFPYDGHWALEGSNRFAEFILQFLSDEWNSLKPAL